MKHLRWRWLIGAAVVFVGAVAAFVLLGNPGKDDAPGPEALFPRTPTGNFRDMVPEVGIDFRMAFMPGEQGENFKVNLYDHGCGVAIADFDGDGFDDIYFCNQLGPNALYKNKGDGTFTDVAAKAGVALGDRICVGACFADYDNDGFPDLYVTSIRGGNVLFRNRGNGTFEDVTRQAGVGWVGHSQTAVFFDYDNDGFLDLLVTNSAKWTLADLEPGGRYYPGVSSPWELARSPKEDNVFFRNNGDGSFSERTAKTGLTGLGWGGDVAVFDYDEDGRQDLLVTNMFGRSQLYRNQPDGTFADVTMKVLGPISFGAIGAKVFDFNNDGRLDLLVADMHSDMWTVYIRGGVSALEYTEKKKFPYLCGLIELAEDGGLSGLELEKKLADLWQIRYDEVLFGNTLFKNLGGGKFAEVSEQANAETFWPWGVAVGDFNNDGFEDVFLPSGMGFGPFIYWPNRLLMNNGNETFSERSREEGIEPPRGSQYMEQTLRGMRAARSSRCAAVGDFRNVGRLDIVTNNFNDRPYFFQNHFPKKNYIAFRLQGTKSNRDALGALVRIHTGSEIMVRQVQGGGGYLSQSSRNLHFGLGPRDRVERVEIRWPSGRRQELHNPAINQRHAVVEPR